MRQLWRGGLLIAQRTVLLVSIQHIACSRRRRRGVRISKESDAGMNVVKFVFCSIVKVCSVSSRVCHELRVVGDAAVVPMCLSENPFIWMDSLQWFISPCSYAR